MNNAVKAPKRQNEVLRDIRKRPLLHIFVWLGLIHLFLFSILPMFGIQMAFREFKLRDGMRGIWTGEWVGAKYLVEFLTDRKFGTLIQNTLSISVLKLIVNFPLAIAFAVMLTEMPWQRFKRVVQTVSYLPHFISWVVVSGITFAFFSNSQGVITDICARMGITMPSILTKPEYYYGLAVFSELWKEMGWNAIIYLAAITGIDPSLYESAQIDGAGRIRRIFSITLPSIKGTIAVLLIMQMGSLMGGNLEQSMLLGNATNISRSEIIELHVYNQGLAGARYSYAAAAGLFQAVMALVLVVSANLFSKHVLEESLF